MAIRVVIAALVGGILMFAGGFAEHMLLDLCARQVKAPADEAGLRATLKSHFPQPGIYGTPSRPENFHSLPMTEQKRIGEQINEQYKQGGAFVVVAPIGEDMMTGQTLGMEFATNVAAALIAAIVLAITRPGIGFAGRWLVVVLIGLFSWVSVNASYFIWYRFPWPWVQDELFCALIEAALAGLAIAAIVRPRAAEVKY